MGRKYYSTAQIIYKLGVAEVGVGWQVLTRSLNSRPGRNTRRSGKNGVIPASVDAPLDRGSPRGVSQHPTRVGVGVSPPDRV